MLDLDIKYAIPIAIGITNTVIALASYDSACHPVGLSESPLFHHEYSSIRDGIVGVGQTLEETAATMASVCALVLPFVDPSLDTWLLLQTDASGVEKAYSKCLEGRQCIKINNNVIRPNKPISVGYPISLVNIGIESTKWSIPLIIKRITSTQSANECTVEQINELIDEPALNLSKRIERIS